MAAAKPQPEPAKKAVKLWHPKADCHIALTSGHTMLVPNDRDGAEVNKRFRREAIARGCIPVGMEDDDDETETIDRKKVITAAFKQMLESDEPGMVTSDGKPHLGKLVAIVGFHVGRDEANRLWDDFNKTEGGADDDDDKPEVVTVGPAGK